MNIICEKHLCTGCGACYNKCPQNAIFMKENEEGSLYLEIDKEKYWKDIQKLSFV